VLQKKFRSRWPANIETLNFGPGNVDCSYAQKIIQVFVFLTNVMVVQFASICSFSFFGFEFFWNCVPSVQAIL